MGETKPALSSKPLLPAGDSSRSSMEPREQSLSRHAMEPYRTLALLATCLGLTSILVAVSTDFWIVAIGSGFSSHRGLWPTSHEDPLKGYIHVTLTFAILSTLLGLVSVGFLVLSCIPSLSGPGRGPLISHITAFASALCATLAMAIYTSQRVGQISSSNVQSYFSWSFYLGWTSVALLCIAGVLSLAAHYSNP